METTPTLPDEVPGSGFTLRCWSVDEAPSMAAVVTANIEHLRPWMPWIALEPVALEDRIALIEQWNRERLEGGDAAYAVLVDGAPVGGTGLHRRIGPGGLEIGYWVARSHTGRGLATAVARLLTTFALSQPGIERVQIHHDRANVPSGRVPRRLGYTLVEERRRVPEAPAESGLLWQWRVRPEQWAG